MKNLFLSFLALLSFGSFGSHYLGGNISWTKNSSGQFIFELRVYKECGTGAATYVDPTIHGPQGNITTVLDTIIDYTPKCTGSQVGCGTSSSGSGGVEIYVMKSAPQTLTGTPPAVGWEFYWTDAARSSVSLVNTNSSGLLFKSTMYDLNSSASPKFIEKYQEPLSPFNNTLSAPARRGNADDSLFYDFVIPMQTQSQAISYASGYSASSPFPSSATNSSNGAISIDGNTGLITYDITTAVTGSYVYAVGVEQWRNGILISRVTMDKIAHYRANAGTNTAPSVAIDTAAFTDVVQTGPYSYEVAVAVGDTLDFDIEALDTDMNSSTFLPQVVAFNVSGSALPAPWGNGAGQYSSLPSLNPVAPQSGFTNTISNTVNFKWPITQGLHVPAANHYNFTFSFKDDHCPFPGNTSVTLQVKVIKGVDIVNDTVQVCSGDSVQLQGYSLNGNYSWQPVSGLSDPGSAAPMASPSSSGYYYLTDGSGSAKDSVFVEVTTPAQFDLNVAGGNLVLTDANATTQLLWNYNGVPFYYPYDTLSFLGLGDYFVTSQAGPCELSTDTIGIWSTNSFSVVDPSNGEYKGMYQVMSGSMGYTFDLDQSAYLNSVTIIGVEDLYKSSGGYDVNLKLYDENEQEVFSTDVALAPPISGLLDINIGYNLSANKEYTIVVSGGNALTFKMLENVQYPLLANSSGITVSGSYEGAAEQFPTQPSSYLLPITLNTDAKVVGLEESMRSTISVYPNPANDVITLSGLETEGQVQLLDIQGRLLRSYQVSSESLMIQREDLSSGVYFLNISVGTKNEVRKVIFR